MAERPGVTVRCRLPRPPPPPPPPPSPMPQPSPAASNVATSDPILHTPSERGSGEWGLAQARSSHTPTKNKELRTCNCGPPAGGPSPSPAPLSLSLSLSLPLPLPLPLPPAACRHSCRWRLPLPLPLPLPNRSRSHARLGATCPHATPSPMRATRANSKTWDPISLLARQRESDPGRPWLPPSPGRASAKRAHRP